eukprot:jgi/Chlat1/6107/Chrsp40S05688
MDQAVSELTDAKDRNFWQGKVDQVREAVTAVMLQMNRQLRSNAAAAERLSSPKAVSPAVSPQPTAALHDNTGGGLFDGMDFVMELTSSSLPPQAESSTTPMGVSSGPLDENLFSGLEVTMEPEPPTIAHVLMTSNNVTSITSLQPTVSPPIQPSNFVTASVAKQPGPNSHSTVPADSRRKKRSFRVGYAREEERATSFPPAVLEDSQHMEHIAEQLPATSSQPSQEDLLPADQGRLHTVTSEHANEAHADTPAPSTSSQHVAREPEATVMSTEMSSAVTPPQPSMPSTIAAEATIASQHAAVTVAGDDDGGDSLRRLEAQLIAQADNEMDKLRAQLQVMEARHRRAIGVLQERQQQAFAARARAFTARRAAAEERRRATAQLAELEEQQVKASEAEDFEQADALSSRIAVAEKQLMDADAKSKAADKAADKAVEAAEQSVQDEVAERLAAAAAASQLILAIEQVDALLRTKAQQQHEATDAELSARSSEYEAARREAEAKVRAAADEEAELLRLAEEASGSDAEVRAALQAECNSLQAEADKLRAALEAKLSEIEDRRHKMSDVVKRIAESTEQFAPARRKVEQEKASAQLELRACEEQLEELEVARNAASLAAEDAEEAGNSHREFVAAAERLASFAAAEADVKQRHLYVQQAARQRDRQLKQEELDASSEAANLRGRINAAQASLQQTAAHKLKLAAQVASAQQRATAAEKRIPELESEKKLAAAARNFKEAGRLANEAKAVAAERDAAAAEASELAARLDSATEGEVLQQQLLGSMQGELKSVSRRAAFASWRRLRQLLQSTKEAKIDAPDDIKAFLQEEEAACCAEIAVLEDIYGFAAEVDDASTPSPAMNVTQVEVTMASNREQPVEAAQRAEHDTVTSTAAAEQLADGKHDVHARWQSLQEACNSLQASIDQAVEQEDWDQAATLQAEHDAMAAELASMELERKAALQGQDHDNDAELAVHNVLNTLVESAQKETPKAAELSSNSGGASGQADGVLHMASEQVESSETPEQELPAGGLDLDEFEAGLNTME